MPPEARASVARSDLHISRAREVVREHAEAGVLRVPGGATFRRGALTETSIIDAHNETEH